MAPPGETFRAGVGMIVMREDGRVLVLDRADTPDQDWQLPQGGLNLGEEPENAAWRELQEETGLIADHVRLVRQSEAWYGYELPVEYRKPKTGRGQTHRWFVFTLRHDAKLPPLPRGKDAEFRAMRWEDPAELVRTAAPFRRDEYRAVVDWLQRPPMHERDR